MPESLKVLFAGTPEFAARALAALIESPHQVVAVYTQPDRPAGRGRKLRPSPVKALALEHDLPVLQPATLKNPDEQATLAGFKADVMVVAAYGLLLPQTVLDIPPLGCINIHASLLPRWRGAAPIQRAILAGDAESGITIMQMEAGLDTGPMLLKADTPIQAEETAESLHDRLAELGATALLDALGHLREGDLTSKPQDDAEATYAKKLEKAEAAIDWARPATEIHRQVRAFNPWPVAQARLDDETVRIWEATITPGSGEPGRVVATGREGIDIATGDGLLRVTRLQLPGGKPLTATEFLNGRNLNGARLANG